MKLLIIGGVAGGAAAAARARRLSENAEIIVFERGGYISYATCGLPYFAGGVIERKDDLVLQTPERLRKRFKLDIRTLCEVVAIDRANKRVRVNDLSTGKEYFEPYDKLILSPGASPFVPPFPGSDNRNVFTVRTIPDIEAVKRYIATGKVKFAAVIGAGFIGIEMAENLSGLGIRTSLIEKLDQVMPPFDKDMAVILSRHMASKGVDLLLGEEVKSLDERLAGLLIKTASGKSIHADLVILSVGVRPETGLAKDAGLEVGSFGIKTDGAMRTSDKDIYAVGDAVEFKNPIIGGEWYVPLAWPAARQAVAAANDIFGIKDEYKGTCGTSIVKVFSLTAGMSGMSEKVLQKRGVKYGKVYTHPANHAGYYPGAVQMSMKLLFDENSGKVLGVEVIGGDGVDKRVDVIAMAIKHGLTVKDLADSDLAYAPPYGSTKDPVNLIGMAAVNHMTGISPLTHWGELDGQEFLLDTRTRQEFAKGSVEGAVNIPVDDLRENLSAIPKDREIAVFCQVGIRGHAALRILKQNGYNVKNISGGYLTYLNHKEATR